MKFEANIPSYLKTGSGSFPVGGESVTKEKTTTNLYKQAQKGFDMSLTNDEDKVLYTPLGMKTTIEPSFVESMQAKAGVKPIRPMMPEELPELEEDIPEELQMQPAGPGSSAKDTDDIETDEDIFIG